MKKQFFPVMLLLSLTVASVTARHTTENDLIADGVMQARQEAQEAYDASYRGQFDAALASTQEKLQQAKEIVGSWVDAGKVKVVDAFGTQEARAQTLDTAKTYATDTFEFAKNYATQAVNGAQTVAHNGIEAVKNADYRAMVAQPQETVQMVFEAAQAKPVATAVGGLTGAYLGTKVVGTMTDSTLLKGTGMVVGGTAGAVAGNVLMSEELGRTAAVTGVVAFIGYKTLKGLGNGFVNVYSWISHSETPKPEMCDASTQTGLSLDDLSIDQTLLGDELS